MSITQAKMARDFRLCGIEEGDLLLVHRALSAAFHLPSAACTVGEGICGLRNF